MTEKTSVEHLPNMDKKQCNDYDMSNTGREKQDLIDIKIVDYDCAIVVYDCTDEFDEFIVEISCDCTGKGLSKEKALEIANLIKEKVKE